MDIGMQTTKSIIYSIDQTDIAENWLSKNSVDIRLDLHGVCDTLDSTTLINTTDKMCNICIISYVGKYTHIRNVAKLDIIDRVTSGQVSFGILVFSRGKIHGKTDFVDADTHHVPGSKAWVNKHLGMNKGQALFVDDSLDHCRSVKSCKRLDNKQIIVKYYVNPTSTNKNVSGKNVSGNKKLMDLLVKFIGNF